ncbi:hypothetical protein E2C01_091913 [Portunus trituberculatus]|uniref:Uncharacterized protein n=1 Tax=Portunus trituberculatus TaxID=210409 RepID=A0A5B7JQC9_PORTR|nr:hypothetical protein [Portunus trituberculatus]
MRREAKKMKRSCISWRGDGVVALKAWETVFLKLRYPVMFESHAKPSHALRYQHVVGKAV